jgi:hypothetical protein
MDYSYNWVDHCGNRDTVDWVWEYFHYEEETGCFLDLEDISLDSGSWD